MSTRPRASSYVTAGGMEWMTSQTVACCVGVKMPFATPVEEGRLRPSSYKNYMPRGNCLAVHEARSVVDHLRRVAAEDVHAEDLARGLAEDDLEELVVGPRPAE